MSAEIFRKGLGDFSSIICLKAIITGLEDVMGEHAARGNLIRAGIKRGNTVSRTLGISKTDKPLEEWASMISDAIGMDGTRLCHIAKVEQDGDIIRVYLSDTICSAGEEPGSSRQLSFTLGAVQGAIEEAMGERFSAKQTGSILRGQDHDIIELSPARRH